MVESLAAPATARSVYERGRDFFLGWILPTGMVSAGAGFIASRWGDDVPQFCRPAANALAGFYNMIIDFFRRLCGTEALPAEQGMDSQIDRSPVFAQAGRELGSTTLADELLAIMHAQTRKDTGFWMSNDPAYARDAAAELNTAVHDHLIDVLHAHAPNGQWNPNTHSEEYIRNEQTAARYAQAISDAYLVLLTHTQNDAAAPGRLTASQVQPYSVEVAAAARDAATPNAAPAPDGTHSNLPPTVVGQANARV